MDESKESNPLDEVKVLEMLASIKGQVSAVLKNIQEAQVSDNRSSRIIMDEKASFESPTVSQITTKPPSIPLDTPNLRDDVKAQREAKKAAKAARKSKGSGPEPSPISTPSTPVVAVSVAKPLVTPKTTNPVLPNVKSEGVQESPKTNAQLKAERRALQEAQREAKLKTPAGGKTAKTLNNSSSTPGTPKFSKGPADSARNIISNLKSGTPDKKVEQLKDGHTPIRPKESHKSDPTVQSSEKKGMETPISMRSSVPKDSLNGVEDNVSVSHSISTLKSGPVSRIQGLFRWINEPSLDDEIVIEYKTDIDPVFQELGLKYSSGMIRGSNKRTVALLGSVKQFVREYRTPEGKGYKQDISTKLKYSFDRLKKSRPFAVGMASAVDGLNEAIRRLKEGRSDKENRITLEEWCDTFIEEKVEKAVEAIAQKGCEKISEGDTILIFSLTDVIYHVFKLAGEQGTKFKLLLVITNSEDYLYQYRQLREMMGAEVFKKNVLVSCVKISSIMSFISAVDKVFLGGHALFTTGGVMSQAGSSTIALCAIQHNIPTLFFCETFKFCDKSPTDAFYRDVFFENTISLKTDRCGSKLIEEDLNNSSASAPRKFGVSMAKIRYDFTPVNLVTCVITDIDMLPSSSVPVVLRVQETRPLTKCL